jgi:hypothetical protein
MDCNQLRTIIVAPVIKEISINSDSSWQHVTKYSQECEDLLVGTYAQESGCGRYIKQLYGPALGPWQMEPKTHDDVWKFYINTRIKIGGTILKMCQMSSQPAASMMVDNIRYACCMARVYYLYIDFIKKLNKPIPTTLEGQAQYWKEHYNTMQGKGTVEEYIANYKRFNGIKEDKIKEDKLKEDKLKNDKAKEGSNKK